MTKRMEATAVEVAEKRTPILSFAARVRDGIQLKRESMDTVQINVGKLCNQTCAHCHVEAGPYRTDIMDRPTAELVLDFVQASGASKADITGGSPELNPSFRFLVEELRRGGCHVIDRSNLTVMLEPGQEDLPAFLAEMEVEIVASLPCYTEENVDSQRGSGTYRKCVEMLRRLNALGYGQKDSGLVLNLVYNPLGAFLPGSQQALEADYKRELQARYDVHFDKLYTIANMPIGRFAHALERERELDAYMACLTAAFNPATLPSLMCRRLVSVSWDGFLYDCDFNQMLGLRLGNGDPFHLGERPAAEIAEELIGHGILTGPHCYGCTAGAGSSCGGALA